MKQKKTFSRQGDAPRRRPAVQKGSAAPRSEAIAPRGEFTVSAAALNGESAALADWWAKYASVENDIVSAQERRRRRAKARRRDRARAIGDGSVGAPGQSVRRGEPRKRTGPRSDMGRTVQLHTQGLRRQIRRDVRHMAPRQPGRFAPRLASGRLWRRRGHDPLAGLPVGASR